LKRSLSLYSLLIILALIAPLSAGTSPLYAQAPTDSTKSDIGVQDEAFELEVIRLVNLERTSRGLHPLIRNSSLTNAARAHNLDMIANNFFDHTGSDGSTPAQRACAHGFTPLFGSTCYVGENIAAGYPTPASVVNGWMGSTGHRANILNTNYREIGIGHNTGGTWGNYWTMDAGLQPNPFLSMSTDTIVFLAKAGSGQTNPLTIPLAIGNAGGDTLHWTASDNAAWLVLSSTSGDAPATVNVSVDNSGGILDSPTRTTATITVNATNPDVVNSPQTVTVVLSVVDQLYSVSLPIVFK
jgi:uncharacterized protein YkwD